MQKQTIWETSKYYAVAHQASEDMSHPALVLLREYANKATSILEVGCGEGTKLAQLVSKHQQGYGVDISTTAITKARKQYPALRFQVGDGEKLPYENNTFDLVYSAFVLEHTQNPETVLKEMIRVTKPTGCLICIAPNYGAPPRRSPCFKGNRLQRLVYGCSQDLAAPLTGNTALNWRKVVPIATQTVYDVDWDTTVEPYLRTLLTFFDQNKLKIIRYSSCWEIKEPQESAVNKLFRLLGTLEVYPFKYWGPHLVAICQKVS